ncbi:hypothetical protein V6N12_002477 [Hibiscus sabdariffa]|uniref:Uncharacterized protein n=1 Tax=Hibiscus sabdariffa TaxID=183260 RepID=A0ABR2B543_9ROSI
MLLGKQSYQHVTKDRLFLRDFSRDKLHPTSMEEKCGESETVDLATSNCSNREWGELELSFKPSFSRYYAKVKHCGVRIVYEKDLEDVQLMKDMKENSASDGSIANGSIEAETEAKATPDGNPLQLCRRLAGKEILYHLFVICSIYGTHSFSFNLKYSFSTFVLNIYRLLQDVTPFV